MRVYPRCVRRGSSSRFSSIKHVPDLARFIHRALPSSLSFRIESLVDALVLTGGSLGSSQDIARRLGLADRFSLCRLLRREGLPSYGRLRSWINIPLWIWVRGHLGYSLEQWAFLVGRNPAGCYRLVRRLTGESWRTVTRRGPAWVAKKFLAQLNAEKAKSLTGRLRDRQGRETPLPKHLARSRDMRYRPSAACAVAVLGVRGRSRPSRRGSRGADAHRAQ